jgi:catechol 2,3-dioxygenase-like lactoylglutathione lyase family enzyme
MKITPVLYLDRIEDSLAFWTDRLGFEIGATVPDGEALGFAILNHGDAEVMLQTWRSAEADAPALLQDSVRSATGSALFVEVDSLDPFRERIPAQERLLAERVTFYGMREIGVRAPSGHVIVLAAREPAEQGAG